MTATMQPAKSKLLATWAALLGGSLGIHRFYLHGFKDVWAWCCIPPTMLGLHGLQRARAIGLDDHLSWVLLPVLGAMLAAGMLTAIVYGLTPNAKWAARFGTSSNAMPGAGPLTILGVVLALALGATVLTATLAFSAQRFFEYQVEPRSGPVG